MTSFKPRPTIGHKSPPASHPPVLNPYRPERKAPKAPRLRIRFLSAGASPATRSGPPFCVKTRTSVRYIFHNLLPVHSLMPQCRHELNFANPVIGRRSIHSAGQSNPIHRSATPSVPPVLTL